MQKMTRCATFSLLSSDQTIELQWRSPYHSIEIDTHGRSYEFGDRAKPNKASKRPFTQASLRGTRWVKPSSLHRMPTPLKRCWMSHLQALSMCQP
jgi:hypothetical protein